MVYSTIAIKLAKLAGVPVSKAVKLVDDIGVGPAKRLADDVAARTGKVVDDAGNVVSTGTKSSGGIVKSYWKPTAVVGLGTAGGFYAFREQDVRRMKEIAETKQSADDALASILDSDLPPEARQKLVEMYLDSRDRSGGKKDDNKKGGGLFGDSTTQLVVTLLVVAVVMNYALNGGNR